MVGIDQENELIVVDIVEALLDHCSIQPDIDSLRVKAAALVAQRVDLKKVMGEENIERCVNPDSDSDEKLKELVIPALCYYTYARLLKMFPGVFTESGYVVGELAASSKVTQGVASEITSIAEVFMTDVLDHLQDVDTDSDDSECYDLETGLPSQDYVDLYSEVKEELRALGFDLKT